MQMNFQASPASLGSSDCLRKARDGWICVEPADAAIGDISELSMAEALNAAKASGVVAAPVQSIARLKEIHRNRPSATVAFRTERGDFPTVNIRPTWFRFDGKPLPEVSPATVPGSDAAAILAELGYGPAAIERLIEEGTVGRPWWVPAAQTPIRSTSPLASEPLGT
jgi:crotonobetainyl-CoA:carnitine CoA-transferase CaiB-like acyl-CoA transferase